MPPLRAIGHLLPLRSPHRACDGKARAKNLLDHHQFHHPHEEYLPPYASDSLRYKFFGNYVDIGKVADAKPMRISEVAAIVLEQTFGKADSLEDVFSVPWGMPENRSSGRVFWDVENDRIIAKTKEGFILALEGTNVVEAAVYLPKIYENLKIQSVIAPIPEGIDLVEAKVEGNEEWSLAASPLHIKCRVPNLKNTDPGHVDNSVKGTLKNALDNRITG